MHHPSSSADFSYEDSGRREPPAPPPPTPILPHSLGVHGYDNTKFSQDIDQNLVSNVITNKNNPHFPIRRYLTSHPRPVDWSSGLFDCFDDVNSCCLTCCCPCVTFGRIAEIVDKGTTSCGVSAALYALIMCITGCSCMYSCFYRSKLRGQYFLEESPCADCCVHCFCEGCALCQEYRELKNQDFDMSIGWHGNMEKQKQSFVEPPSTQYGMKR